MTKQEKDRIEELERKIDELLARPIVQPIIVQPYPYPAAALSRLTRTSGNQVAGLATFNVSL